MKVIRLFLIVFILVSTVILKSQNILLGPEHFNANIIRQLPCADPCNLWISLAQNKAHSILYYQSGGCTDSYAGYSGNNNNYFFGALRTPILCTQDMKNIKVKYNFSNSYIASHLNYDKKNFDQSRVTMWDVEWGKTRHEYIWPDSIKINGVLSGYYYMNQFTILFDKLRTCDTIEAFFTMPSYPNNNYAYFYIDEICGWNDSETFSFAIDNVEISSPTAQGVCGVYTSVADNKAEGLVKIISERNNIYTLSSIGLDKSYDIYVYGSEGRLIKSEKLQANSTNELNFSDYPKGVYLIKVINETEDLNRKVLVY